MAKYLVTGTYTYKQVVDTEDPWFVDFAARHPLKEKLTEEQMVEAFAEHDCDDMIIDDEGQSEVTAGYLDWTVSEIHPGGRVSKWAL